MAGQAHNDAKLEEIMGACKLLRIFGKYRARCAKPCNFSGSAYWKFRIKITSLL